MTEARIDASMARATMAALTVCFLASCVADTSPDDPTQELEVSQGITESTEPDEQSDGVLDPDEAPVTEAEIAAAEADAALTPEELAARAALDDEPAPASDPAPPDEGAAAAAAAAAAATSTVRVMTWNGQTQYHGADEWARVVGNQKPHILAMQEVCVREIKQLIVRLKDRYDLSYHVSYGTVRRSRDLGCNAIRGKTGAYGQALLTRYAPRSAKNVLYARQAPDGQKRGYQAVTVTLPGGNAVRVFNTHIATERAVQKDQVDQLARDARAFPKALVLGDINLKPDRAELAPLKRSFSEVDPRGEHRTYKNDPHDRDHRPTSKVDYIFMRGLRRVSGPETYWTASSDHRPLIAGVR